MSVDKRLCREFERDFLWLISMWETKREDYRRNTNDVGELLMERVVDLEWGSRQRMYRSLDKKFWWNTFWMVETTLSSSVADAVGKSTYRSNEPKAIFLYKLIGSILGLFTAVVRTRSNVSIFNCLMSCKSWSIFCERLFSNLLFEEREEDFSLDLWDWLRKIAPISGLHSFPCSSKGIVFRWRRVCKPGRTP